MRKQSIPNLFLIGAPKCGTTTLARYLSHHPSIFMSPIKEPHFFAPEWPFSPIHTEKDYLALFDGAGPLHKWKAEASTLYLYYEGALDRVARFNPEARYVIMLRDPLPMIQSWHAHLLADATIIENCATLDEAWSLIPERKAGRSIPPYCQAPELLFYDDIARYHLQITRAPSLIIGSNVFVIFFDELSSDPDRVCSALCQFLDIEFYPTIELSKDNQRVEWRSAWVRALFANPIAPRVKALLNSFGIRGLVGATRSLLYRPATVLRPSHDTEANIRNCYAADVEALADLLDVNLGHWLQPIPPSAPGAVDR